MLCINSANTDPYYNLAAEEYYLRHTGTDLFMVWRSEPAVVVGKHQNTLSEINYPFVTAHKIKVARRLTGGGAVYHDPGNINFTFIRQGEPGKLVDFGSFIAPVIYFLQSIGIDASRGPKNEILVNGRKISGNAEHVYKNRILHHGTLLYSTDLEKLTESIRPALGTYKDKSVQSNRSSVMNLCDITSRYLNAEDFMGHFFETVAASLNGTGFTPDTAEQLSIDKLTKEKYRTWDWIYGWSPDYQYQRTIRLKSFKLILNMQVHKGLIADCTFQSPDLAEEELIKLAGAISGQHHEESEIRSTLTECRFLPIAGQQELDDLVLSFFY